MPYPELFWSQYTSLGSQTQTPKHSKVLISGVSFCQCSLLQSQESNVLSYVECKIAKNFQGFTPGLHWGELTAIPQTPQLHNGFSPRYAHQKTGTPQNCWIRHWWSILKVYFLYSFSCKGKFKWRTIKTVSYMVAAPPNYREGPKNFRPK